MIIDNVQFIANILSVATADGQIHPAEEVQHEEIRKHFKFSKTDWNNAEKLLNKPGFKVRPTGTFADKMVNLEMMIRVACADGDTSVGEVSTISDFCAEVGITQEQLDALYSEVLAEINIVPLRCPKCGMQFDAGSKFCPSCGAALADTAVKVSFDIPSEGIAIAFAESESAKFSDICDLAKETPGFQECLRGKKTWYLATFQKKTEELFRFADIVTALRNRELYIDGKKIAWEEAFPCDLLGCVEERSEAYNPVCYCFGKGGDEGEFNPVGCRLLGLNWGEYKCEWARMGKWEQRGAETVWRFDKERIRHHIVLKTHAARLCPYLNEEVVDRFLAVLPDVVNPQKDNNWDFHSIYHSPSPGAIHVIREKSDGGFTYNEDFYSDGLIPKGFGFFKKILNTLYGNQECLKALF